MRWPHHLPRARASPQQTESIFKLAFKENNLIDLAALSAAQIKSKVRDSFRGVFWLQSIIKHIPHRELMDSWSRFDGKIESLISASAPRLGPGHCSSLVWPRPWLCSGVAKPQQISGIFPSYADKERFIITVKHFLKRIVLCLTPTAPVRVGNPPHFCILCLESIWSESARWWPFSSSITANFGNQQHALKVHQFSSLCGMIFVGIICAKLIGNWLYWIISW